MPRIAVSPSDLNIPIAFYDDATKWVVDEKERLHVIGPNGNLASYNRDAWAAVQFSPAAAGTPDLCDQSETQD